MSAFPIKRRLDPFDSPMPPQRRRKMHHDQIDRPLHTVFNTIRNWANENKRTKIFNSIINSSGENSTSFEQIFRWAILFNHSSLLSILKEDSTFIMSFECKQRLLGIAKAKKNYDLLLYLERQSGWVKV